MPHQDQPVRLCTLPQPDPFAMPAGLGQPRSEAIRLNRAKWPNGTEITFHFVADPRWDWPDAQKEVVRLAFGKWKALGIGLSFRERPTAAGATLLIGRLQGDGSWSYVGTDVLTNRRNGCNMNFGWDLTTAWGRATALHEIGHALGMPHEHQNPDSGLVWDDDAVIAEYTASQDWSEQEVRWNILRKLSPSEVEGSSWDPRSVMHYPFGAGLIKSPEEWKPGTPRNFELSDNDRRWVARFYPPIANAAPVAIGREEALPVAAGAQAVFAFRPEESRLHTVTTTGTSDTRVTVYADGDGRLEPIAEGDDAARDENAELTVQLEKGRPYVLAVQTFFADKHRPPALLIT